MASSSRAKEADRYFRQSRNAEKRNDLIEALRCIDEAIRLSPSDTAHWSAKAQYLKNSNEYSEAKMAAERAIEINSENYHAWSTLGLINVQTENYEEAALCYKRSLERKEDAAVYTLLAAVEYEFDVESAILHAEKALALEPDWDEAIAVLKAAKEKEITIIAKNHESISHFFLPHHLMDFLLHKTRVYINILRNQIMPIFTQRDLLDPAHAFVAAFVKDARSASGSR